MIDRREVRVSASPAAVFEAVCRVGGDHGWYGSQWLWRIRGALDRLVGGPGLRRGRKDPDHLSYGEALDFWRVTAVEPNRRLALRAEMRLPGEALLEFDIHPVAEAPAASVLTQTAVFKPKGLLGLAYWYGVLPLHGVVFSGMLDGIRRAAESMPEVTKAAAAAGGGPR